MRPLLTLKPASADRLAALDSSSENVTLRHRFGIPILDDVFPVINLRMHAGKMLLFFFVAIHVLLFIRFDGRVHAAEDAITK